MRDIASPLDGFASPFGPVRRTLTNLLFSASEPGFTFEPWDITTLFQDRAGTTPVTAAGQSVGLRLDKSKGLALGPELVTNGDFSSGLTGWSNTGSSTSIWESGAARWSTATAEFSGFRSASFATVVGRTYEFTATVLENTGSAWRIVFVNGDGSFSNGTDNYTTPGTRTARFIATQTTSFVEIRNGTAATANRLIDNISVRELAGNHEVAVSDAKRGVYGWMPKTGKRNLLTYTEQFDNAAWLKSAATATASVEIDPTGGASAFRAQLEASASAYIYQANITSIPNGQNYTISMWVRSNIGVAQTFRLFGDGTLDNSADLTATSDWQRFTFSAVSSGGTSYGIRANSTNGAADILIWGAQLELGASATAYQRVVSQYDITEAGVPTCYYVQADGVDDAYVTPTITPNTDKAQVFAGVRRNIDVAGAIIEFSSGINVYAGSVALFTGTNSGTALGNGFQVGSRGSVFSAGVFGVSPTLTPPVSAVLTGLTDIAADSSVLRGNGVAGTTGTADQGTGNYLAYPAYIYSRGGTSLPFNGLDFGHAVRFGPNLDAATIARVESLIARNTPEVTL